MRRENALGQTGARRVPDTRANGRSSFGDHQVGNGQCQSRVSLRRTTTSAVRRLFIQLLNNLRNRGNAAMRQKRPFANFRAQVLDGRD